MDEVPEPPASPLPRVVRRRGQAAPDAPPAQASITGEEGHATSPSLRNQGMQWNFFAALGLGAALAAAGTFDSWLTNLLGVVGPIAAVVGFYVFGRKLGWARHSDTRQKFADSCYFLGFIFTMWALLIGFLPAGVGLHTPCIFKATVRRKHSNADLFERQYLRVSQSFYVAIRR